MCGYTPTCHIPLTCHVPAWRLPIQEKRRRLGMEGELDSELEDDGGAAGGQAVQGAGRLDDDDDEEPARGSGLLVKLDEGLAGGVEGGVGGGGRVWAG